MTQLCARVRPFVSSPFSRTLSIPNHFPLFKLRPSTTTRTSQSITMSSSIVDHVVLLKVKSDAEPSKITAMLTALNGLAALDVVAHISAGPILTTTSSSSPFNFTHALLGRYTSKENLGAYAVHPHHVDIVKNSVNPISDDLMAIDWVADPVPDPVSLAPGSALKMKFLKLKENLPDNVKKEIIEGIKGRSVGVQQIDCGENFCTRAKGFSIASISVFRDLSELEAKGLQGDLETDKVNDYIESMIVVNYVVPSSSSNL